MDNRIAPRYDIALQVHVGFAETDGSFVATTHDISESGVRVLADRAVLFGTRLVVAFPSFGGTAEVIWSKESDEERRAQIGMKFVSLDPADREALMDLLQGAAAVQGH